VAVTQHLDDLVQVVSYNSAAAKEANRYNGVSRWLVAGKPLPLKLAKHGRVARVAADAEAAAEDPTLPQEALQPLMAAKSAALERALLLFKVLGNLHYWVKDLPAQQQERFVQLLVGGLRHSTTTAAQFDTACRRVVANLKALERWALSLRQCSKAPDACTCSLAGLAGSRYILKVLCDCGKTLESPHSR